MTHSEQGVTPAAAGGGAPIAYLPWVQHETPEEDPYLSLPDGIGSYPNGKPELVPISSSLLEELQYETDEGERADQLVLRKLARRGMSQREVEIELSRELDIDKVIFAVQRYIRLGYIDDDRLAEQIVRVQRERKGQGVSGIRHELERRGIPSAVSARVLAELDDDEELERATELAADRLRRLAAEAPEVQQRRVMGFLMRRGYSSGIASKAIRAAQQ